MSVADAQHLTACWSELSPMRPDIDVAALIDRLQAHALADAPGAMTHLQVDTALALLDQVLPDLHCVELRSPDGQPMAVLTGGAVTRGVAKTAKG
jgi:hypothetical protein